ncbi:MAG: c-type cytochrome [Methylobacter sp.]
MKKLPFLMLVLTAVLANASLAGEPSPARQNAIRNMLNHDCGACHGLTLKGGLGPSLLPEALAGKPDEFLISTILNGRPGTAMPPWQPFMNRDEAAWLVGILRKSESQHLK